MTKTQHKKTAVASMFQNGISVNTKCAERDGFCRVGHILYHHLTCSTSATSKKIRRMINLWFEHLCNNIL